MDKKSEKCRREKKDVTMDKLFLKHKWLLLAVLLLDICLVITGSFAWQATNRRNTADGIVLDTKDLQVNIKYRIVNLPDTPGGAETYSEWGTVDINWETMNSDQLAAVNALNLASLGMCPGDVTVFELMVENIGASAFSVDSFGFLAPIGGMGAETAMHNARYDEDVYLGTQLFETLLAVDSTPLQDEPVLYLAGFENDTLLIPRIPIYATSGSTVISGGTKASVVTQAGESRLFRFSVTFGNADTSQDAYKHFGESTYGGKCSRCLFIECNPR